MIKPTDSTNTAAARITADRNNSTAPAAEKASSSAAPASSAARSRLTTVYQDQFVKVVSDDSKLTKDQGAALAKKIEDTYKWDTSTLGWTETSPLEGKQLTVEALTKAGFDQVLGGDSTGTAGVTMGPNLMAVPENLTSSTNPDDDDTIAHELVHVMDFREGGNKVDHVPIYLQEGHAYTIGDLYPIHEGKDAQDPVLGGIARSLTKVTADQARDVMDHYRDPSAESDPNRDGFRDETTGALYVNFLKSQLGFEDVLPRIAQVVQDVGKGSDYDTAFKKQFGISSTDSENKFVQFMKDTENKPEARLEGTIWEPYLHQPSK